MILGDQECDEEIAYFLKHGERKPYKRTCTFKPPEFDWETVNEPSPYYCWRGRRIPQWFE